MGSWLHHWIVNDFIVPVWPNIAADVMAAGWTISRVKTHLHRHHEAVRALVETEKPPAPL